MQSVPTSENTTKDRRNQSRFSKVSLYMICLIRTMNPVTLSFAQAVLKDAGIESFLFDMHASILDGSTTIVRRRLMIIDEDEMEATELLVAAGLGKELMSAAPEPSDQPKNTFLSNLLRKLNIAPK